MGGTPTRVSRPAVTGVAAGPSRLVVASPGCLGRAARKTSLLKQRERSWSCQLLVFHRINEEVVLGVLLPPLPSRRNLFAPFSRMVPARERIKRREEKPTGGEKNNRDKAARSPHRARNPVPASVNRIRRTAPAVHGECMRKTTALDRDRRGRARWGGFRSNTSAPGRNVVSRCEARLHRLVIRPVRAARPRGSERLPAGGQGRALDRGCREPTTPSPWPWRGEWEAGTAPRPPRCRASTSRRRP